MQIVVSGETGSTAKVVLIGKLDVVGADAVAQPLASLAGAKTGLIVDMSGVTFIVSKGLHQLISAAKALARRGGKLVLVNPNAVVQEVLVAAGIVDLMPIVATEGEAVALIG